MSGLAAGRVVLTILLLEPIPAVADEVPPVPEHVELELGGADRSGLVEAWLTRPPLGLLYLVRDKRFVGAEFKPLSFGGLAFGVEMLGLGLITALDLRLSVGDIRFVNTMTILGGVVGELEFTRRTRSERFVTDNRMAFMSNGAGWGTAVGIGLAALIAPTPSIAGLVGIGAAFGAIAFVPFGLAMDHQEGFFALYHRRNGEGYYCNFEYECGPLPETDFPRHTAAAARLGLVLGAALGAGAGWLWPVSRLRIQATQLGMGLGGLAATFISLMMNPAEALVWLVETLLVTAGAVVGLTFPLGGSWETMRRAGVSNLSAGVVSVPGGVGPSIGGRF